LLASILERAQSRDRASRYQDFDALLADLARLLLQVRKTDLHFSGLFETPALSGPDPTHEAPPEESIHVTVHRPPAVCRGEWKALIVAIESSSPIPLESELTFVPQVNGVEFNPARVSFQWMESSHQASFRLRASAALDGQSAHGQMCVYLGRILVAQVPLA